MATSHSHTHSPLSDPHSDADVPPEEEQARSPSSAPDRATVAPTPSFWSESKAKVDVTLLLSIVSVACWALAGNAARLALHAAFLSIPFFNTYEFFGPNCIGSFAMGFFGYGLPPEKDLPLVHRALGVGFCGSFTTFSSWIVDIVNKDSAGGAFEELISGLTIPFVFFVWGKDTALGIRWVLQALRKGRCAEGTAQAADESGREEKRREVYAGIQYVFLASSCAAAISIPIAVQVRINQGRIRTVRSDDIKAVALGPAGAVVRFLLSVFLNKRAQWKGFPVGTLAANALGVLLVVFMDNYAHHRPWNGWFWVVANGVCGALSTVSSFVNETAGFYFANRPVMAYVYCLVSLVVTILIGAVGRRGNFT